jgi:hypothetical protein
LELKLFSLIYEYPLKGIFRNAAKLAVFCWEEKEEKQ